MSATLHIATTQNMLPGCGGCTARTFAFGVKIPVDLGCQIQGGWNPRTNIKQFFRPNQPLGSIFWVLTASELLSKVNLASDSQGNCSGSDVKLPHIPPGPN